MTRTSTAAVKAADRTRRLKLVHPVRRPDGVDRNDGLAPVRRALRQMEANDRAQRFAHLKRMHD